MADRKISLRIKKVGCGIEELQKKKKFSREKSPIQFWASFCLSDYDTDQVDVDRDEIEYLQLWS